MPKVYSVRYGFKAMDRKIGQGAPIETWIHLEPIDDDLPFCGEKGFLSFQLPEGTTYDRARKIAEFLEQNITRIAFQELP